MTFSPSFDALHWGLLGLLGWISALWLRERGRANQSQTALMDLESELQKLQNDTRQLEYRVDRFDVLWFPHVVVSDAEREIVSVLPGPPYCRKCLEPLASKGGGPWACARCFAEFPPSLSDLVVVDTITRTAHQYFQERNKGFKLGPSVRL